MRGTLRGLLALVFLFAVLGVHPCDSKPSVPAADHVMHHAMAHQHGAPKAPDSKAPDSRKAPAKDACVAGACDVGVLEDAAGFQAPAVHSDVVPVVLSPDPLGSPAVRTGFLHSGQSPGGDAVGEPDLALLSVSRT